jgi:hypothetical protein
MEGRFPMGRSCRLVATLLLGIALADRARCQDVSFLRADANIDGSIDISDGVFTLIRLFADGTGFPCLEAADSNDDGAVDVSDAIHILAFLFQGGLAPPAPFPEPGIDPALPGLGCERYGPTEPDAIIADHTRADLAGPPEGMLPWVEEAKETFRIYYGHTSHGSQIMSGLDAMRDAVFDYNDGEGTLSIVEVGGDLGNPDFTAWADTTRAQLQKATNDRNVVMWSWCGQVSGASEEVIERDYLGNMDALEKEFPEVRFIYMTGHLDGTGPDENLHLRNEQIRAFCRENGKVLFDFADIESFDPDGAGYLEKMANDNCDYRDGGTTRNWAGEWCEANPGKCSSCSCAHSQSLNCDRKARAFWRLLARMAETLEP